MAAAACCEESVDRARREHKKSSGKVARLPLPVVAAPCHRECWGHPNVGEVERTSNHVGATVCPRQGRVRIVC